MPNPEPEGPFEERRSSGGDLLPAWLLAVYAALLAWGAWYLAANWGGPGAPPP